MTNVITQEIIDKHKECLVDIQKKDIDAIALGFVNNDCTSMLYSILIHCLENTAIFDDEQLNNIQHYLNKLNYGR